MLILGIETSCDETAASVVKGQDQSVEVLSNVISSQIDIHREYGGVVPEVAAREHILNILPVIDSALQQAGLNKTQASDKLDAIAVTVGPGLITSLISGLTTAKTLARAWNIPIIAINHIAGHIYANFINAGKIKWPLVILTVSGGHTMLIKMTEHLQYQTLGDTRDDAAGEAFDKAAKLLGLGYPGGPAIAQAAEHFIGQSDIVFPRPMSEKDNYDFSFSGLKTSLLYKLKKDLDWPNRIPEYACQYQVAIVDSLVTKTLAAAERHNAQTIMLAGGVSANLSLRKTLLERAAEHLPQVQVLIPDLAYTTDNAAMVACAGYFKLVGKQTTAWTELSVDPNLKL
ncbi:MAG: tRNA (adenosine(37)-N6)-threonylcarbamoyltransferase complex transferase subunit TsaD [bacterium]